VTGTGAAVSRLAEVAGSVVRGRAAVLHDADAWWALDSQGLPSAGLDYPGSLRRAHRALWDAGVTTDFAHPADPGLARYPLLVAPALYLLSETAARTLRDYVRGGGTLLVQHFSGVADEHHQAWLGGYPAPALREALGVRVEEYRPLAHGEAVRLSDGSTGTVWSESVQAAGATAEATYIQGMLAGRPALTRHSYGAGTAWYLSTRLDGTAYDALLARLIREAAVTPELMPPRPGVEAVRRRSPDGSRSWLFVLNHTGEPVHLPEVAGGHDLLTGRQVPAGGVRLPARGVAVLRQE
jgi:beta-galactosidase